MEAIYVQGHKDGAATAFEALNAKFAEAQKAIAHKKPRQTKKSQKEIAGNMKHRAVARH